jgi:hypothetical protein
VASLGGRNDLDLVAELLRHRPAWMRDALCREYGPDVMIPVKQTGEARAIEVCRRCAVLEECRAWSLGDDAPTLGIVGGMTPAQRRTARRAAPAA